MFISYRSVVPRKSMMDNNCLLLSVLFLAVAASAFAESNVVTIKQGPVKGYKVPGLDIFAYYGIPYATMPKGRDRFKAPLPPPQWTEPFEAVDGYIVCPQHRMPDIQYPHSEDCLVANVYVPDTNVTNLPVMVFVHGGGFQMGYSNWDAPRQLVNHRKNIIALTFNYRLGPHGFLCLGTEDVPGNAGMRDQVTLLRWVKDNIADFGGNPDDVTIAGCSAGGASVDLLMLSKMANGLFKKVIGQSGANVGVFAAQVDPTENAREYAKKINYDGPDNLKDMEEFYKSISMEQLLSVNYNENKDVAVRFSPCVERDLGFERFLDDTPINIITSGDYVRYPMMYGYSAMEGLFRIEKFDEWKDEMNEDFTRFLPADLLFESEEEKRQVGQTIKEYYFGNKSVSGDTVQGFVDYNSDVMFIVAMHRSLTWQVRSGNNEIYLHVFSYTDENTEVIPYSGGRGATHCAQSYIVSDADESKMTPEYLELSSTLRDLWLNFIHTGQPTPEGKIPASMPRWEAAREDRAPCMHFGSTNEVIGPFEKKNQDFWDDIYDRYHRAPVAPYDF